MLLKNWPIAKFKRYDQVLESAKSDKNIVDSSESFDIFI